MAKSPLTIDALQNEARVFASIESTFPEPSLYGRSDGKKVGTYLEHKFRAYLIERYDFTPGNSANGVDFPELNVDMKATSHKQPQSSCHYSSPSQKIFGLGYSLLVFVYLKTDDPKTETSTLDIQHVVLVPREMTADYQMTRGIADILGRDGNEEDLISFIADRGLIVDQIEVREYARRIFNAGSINLGFLTISNALQWRLQYGHAIKHAGEIDAPKKIL